jgi:hypothetical protein
MISIPVVGLNEMRRTVTERLVRKEQVIGRRTWFCAGLYLLRQIYFGHETAHNETSF